MQVSKLMSIDLRVLQMSRLHIPIAFGLECIRENKQPVFPFDIHSAVNMSSVAILAHRSILNGGIPYDIPDFHNEDARLQYEKDDATPFYYSDGRTPNIPCCSHPDYKPTDKQLKEFYDSIKD